MIKTEITCDNCNKDLRHTSYQYEYYLSLGVKNKINNSGACYAIGLSPQLDQDKHFCGLKCLELWLLSSHKENSTNE